jgi:hypothetical protein
MIIWNEPFYFLNIYIRKFINTIIKIMSIILFINKMIKITLQKHFKNDFIKDFVAATFSRRFLFANK